MNQILHWVDSLICTPKTGNHRRSHLRAIMALDHRRLIRPGKKSGQIFCVRQVYFAKSILPTNLGVCKPTFYTIYTLHLRWNSTMSHCFYHTDLGQTAVFPNFATQIALLQYSGRSEHVWAFKAVNTISKITYTASRFSLLQCEL